MGISPMGNLGRFLQGKPAATVALPNLNKLLAQCTLYFCVYDHTTGYEAYSFTVALI